MTHKGRWGWWVALLCCAGACDQELVIPKGMQNKMPAMEEGPGDGVTGASGAGAETESKPRLPVSEPSFTTFGGAGGEGGSAGATDGGEPTHGETSGGVHSSGGTHTTGGTTAAGGTKAGAGASSGGVSGGGGKPGSPKGGTAPVLGGTGNDEDGGAGGNGIVAGPPVLWFSEYVEGSGSFKALEIYALTASSLEGCDLETYSNGKTEPARLALHGAVEAGKTHVLCSSSLATAQPALCDRSTSLSFNGDDALALRCGGKLLDVFGQIGVDPGDAWNTGATLDHTLRRRCTVTQGRLDGEQPFDVDAEWVTFGIDTFSGLGAHDCAAPR